jgi:hypothetical protein
MLMEDHHVKMTNSYTETEEHRVISILFNTLYKILHLFYF